VSARNIFLFACEAVEEGFLDDQMGEDEGSDEEEAQISGWKLKATGIAHSS
jgi:hypothetical protein